MNEEKNIHQRIAAVMQKVTYIRKERKQGMQYTIVSHDAVTAKVRPVLLDNGVIYYPVSCNHSQNGNRAECSMTVRFVNIDKPEDFIDVESFGYGVDSQDKGPGKAMSYAVKYALLKCLGLETGDDADHDSTDHSKDDPATKAERDAKERDRLKSAIVSKTDEAVLDKLFGQPNFKDAVNSLPEPMQLEIRTAYNNRMAEIAEVPA